MCTPLAAVGFGLQAIGQVAGFAGQSQATDEYNKTAAQNAVNASVAASHQYEDEGRKMVYNSKQIMQEGYKTTMESRRAKGTAIASAGSSGIDASSLSVESILASIDQDQALSEANTKTKMDDLDDQYKSNTTSEEAQAQGRINSMPFKKGPSPLGLAINIASGALDATTSTNWGKNMLTG
jgi:hypothetical protein